MKLGEMLKHRKSPEELRQAAKLKEDIQESAQDVYDTASRILERHGRIWSGPVRAGREFSGGEMVISSTALPGTPFDLHENYSISIITKNKALHLRRGKDGALRARQFEEKGMHRMLPKKLDGKNNPAGDVGTLKFFAKKLNNAELDAGMFQSEEDAFASLGKLAHDVLGDYWNHGGRRKERKLDPQCTKELYETAMHSLSPWVILHVNPDTGRPYMPPFPDRDNPIPQAGFIQAERLWQKQEASALKFGFEFTTKSPRGGGPQTDRLTLSLNFDTKEVETFVFSESLADGEYEGHDKASARTTLTRLGAIYQTLAPLVRKTHKEEPSSTSGKY
jgi:hypothetical protein